MKRPLDVRHRTVHTEHHPVGVQGGDPQAVGLGKGHQSLVIILRGTELIRKLPRSQVLMIPRAARIVDFGQQIRQRVWVLQRKPNGKIQSVGGRQPP